MKDPIRGDRHAGIVADDPIVPARAQSAPVLTRATRVLAQLKALDTPRITDFGHLDGHVVGIAQGHREQGWRTIPVVLAAVAARISLGTHIILARPGIDTVNEVCH